MLAFLDSSLERLVQSVTEITVPPSMTVMNYQKKSVYVETGQPLCSWDDRTDV